jgi:transcriptional regulator with XRE-family HTH domain
MVITQYCMLIGKNIKKVREAKGLSQKEVALTCKMDTGHYSRIEGDKSDPALSSLTKISKALGVDIVELFTADDVFKDVNSVDKTLMEKISLIELLDKKEKAAFFTMLDALVSKKKLKDNLTTALQLSA